MSGMYIRVKRTNQTIFLYVEPNETINEVRKKIASILKLPNADQIRLLSAADHHPLQDDKTLQDNKIDNDNIVYWVQKKEGTDTWEEVNIQKLEPREEKTEEKST